MKNLLGILLGIGAWLLLLTAGLAQEPAEAQPEAQPQFGEAISGMYSFLHEGEFVQIEVNGENVTGVVSRYKDEDKYKSEFVDQFLDQGKLDGARLSFRTKPAGGMVYEFSGTVERGPGKTPADEGYWNLRGTLIERITAGDGSVTEKRHALTLRSFPQDAEPSPVSQTVR